MPITNEQLTIIRAGLDASAYQSGASVVISANQQMAASGAPVVAATDNNVRAYLGLQRQIEGFRRATIDGYTETAKFAQIQDTLTRAVNLAQISTTDANQILSIYAERFGLVSAQARVAAQAIQDVQIQSLAAADAIQRASQAQAAYNARSGSPGTSAPVSGAGYGPSAGGGNPLYGDAYAARQADLDAYGAALDSVKAKFVPLFAAQQQYESELAAITEAVNVGAISETEAAAAREGVAESYLKAKAALVEYTNAQRDAAALAAEQPASQAQAAYNSRSGALGSNPLYGAAYDARQGDIESAFTDADKQRAAVDDLYAASKRYESVLEQIQTLNRTGVFNDAQADEAMKKATTNYANQANMAGSLGIAIDKTNQTATAASHGLSILGNGGAFATRELIVLGHEALVGNFSRIPGSLLVLTSHVQVLRESMLALVTSTAGLSLIGGLAGAGALIAFSIAAESNNRQIETLQNRLSLVRTNYVAAGEAAQAAAVQMAKATGDSVADARTGTSDLFSNKAFQGNAQQAANITGIFYNLGKALGDTTTDWGRMTQALNDPAALLKSLQGQIDDINSDLITQVERLEASGDKAGAFALVMKTLTDATSHVIANQTPLEEALRRVDGMFITADGHGNTLTKTIGGFGTQAAVGAVYAFGIIVAEINKVIEAFEKLNAPFKGFETTVISSLYDAITHVLDPIKRVKDDLAAIQSILKSIPGVTSAASAITGNAALTQDAEAGPFTAPAPSAANVTAVASAVVAGLVARGVPQLDAIALAAMNQAETGGQFIGPGAVGDPSIQAGVDPRYGAYPGGSHGGFQWNRGRLADFMSQNNGQLPENTTMDTQLDFVVSELTGAYKTMYETAKGAADLTTKTAIYTKGYEGPADVPGQTRVRQGIATNIQAQVGTGAAPAPAPAGQAASDSSNVNTYGVINPPDTTLTDALKLTGGTAASQVEALQDHIGLLNKALAQTGNSASDVAKLTQELQKAQLEMYNAVPAAQGLYRAVDIQTTAEAKLASAWTQGAAAAGRLTIQTKAEAEARTVAAPGTAEYTSVVAGLTAKYLALAAATQDVTLAQKTSANQDILAYLQAESSSLTMNDEQRTVMLAHLKEELDLKRSAPNADAAYISGTLASTDAIAKNTYELAQNKQSLSEIAGTASTAFDSIGTAVSQSLVASKGAIVDWGNVMTTVIQQIIQEMLKLAIINPILNEAFGGNRSTISDIGGAFGGGASGGASGGLLGGLLKMTPGGAWNSLFGSSAGVAAGTSNTSAAAGAFGSFDGLASGATDTTTLFLDEGTGFHRGGRVGDVNAASFYRNVPASTFVGAPRYHTGLAGDEFAAILQRGEQVLTAKQAQQNAAILKQVAGGSGGTGGNTTVNHWNITTPDVDGFARSKGQVMALASKAFIRQMAK